MLDILQEILGTIRRNKLRTALTGFAVAWGIFILIVLLGAGNGLVNAFEKSSSERALNSIRVFPGWTSKAYAGMREGRRVELNNGDLELTREKFAGRVGQVAPSRYQGGCTVSYGQEYISANLDGYYPEQTALDGVKMLKGRYINKLDVDGCRKVAVLGNRSAEILFDKSGAEPIGSFINVGGVAYRVVGIYKTENENGQHEVVIPFSTLQLIYGKGRFLHNYTLTIDGLETMEANDAFEDELLAALGESHHFAADDDGAVWFWNRMKQYIQSNTAMKALKVAIWVIGIFTLLSGIVGVSNIMLITVKERTREFGIRKALGAKPRSILALVMAESVAITTFFGYIGMVAGIGVTELAAGMMGDGTMSNGMWSETVFTNPTVDISVAIEATLTLIVAGSIAGFIPARKAVSIRPIEALRAD